MTPYYDRNGITIYCGDCLDAMRRLDLVFDAIMADLPYGTTSCAWDTIIPFEPLWENYKRLGKGNGAIVLTSSDPFTPLLQMSNFEWYRYKWVWEKNTGSRFLDSNRRPLNFHEDITVFYQMQPTFNPQKYRGTKNHSRKNTIGNDRVSLHTGKALTPPSDQSGEKYPKNVIYCPTVPPSLILHPTQKPVALLAYLIRTYTNPGEIVLDNTMGSGTTLVAAQREGRRAIGIDISEDYCKIAVDRLRQPSFFSIPDKPKIEPAEQPTLFTCDPG